MDFTDDEAAASSDNVLVPSSQGDADPSLRPRKRQRVNSFPSLSDDDSNSESHSDQYDLPSNDAEESFNQNDLSGNKSAPKESLLHQQMIAEAQKNVFVTQVDQPWSSPTRIRGPRWRKKSSTPPSPLQVAVHQAGTTERSYVTLNRSEMHPGSTVPDEFDDEELDALMMDRDLENNMLEVSEATASHTRSIRDQSRSLKQTTLFGMNTSQQRRPASSMQAKSHNWPLADRNETPSHHKMNLEALKTWVYPLNVGTLRDYQYNIVHKALFNNLLVALPTGLGKTFIAASVMLNWFNWTRDTQIVFMAPTKPLVAQQINACFHIAGIPRSQTTMLTGEVSVPIRVEEWQEKRVFFMTPQTFINDLKSGIADPKKIVLLVIDEAHKATGNFSYVEVVRFLRRFNSSFRVLALTATPGASVEAVQKVIDALDIARVEIRTEDSLDIRAFVHSRNTELEIFDYSEEMTMCLELFGASIKPVMDKLCSQNAYWSKDPTAITLYGLMQARRQWITSEAGRNANQGLKSMIHACFTPLMSLAHNLELLKYHGIGPFFHKMKIFEQEAGNGKYVKQITGHADFKKLMNRLKVLINNEDFVGHPKLTYLNTVVLNHFMDAGDGHNRAGGRPPSDTRIMIFAHYRDSAEEITRILNRHGPMIRAHIFVGQSGTKGSEGMNQKTQLDIIQKFKAGTYNTLVATSIGEEGLDIGEVDLIVCYDCSKSPIRMLQRMGRTGRKRAGNIVVLLMRGTEERDYYSAKDNYRKIQEIIESGREFEFHDDRSPRIVPREILPVVDKRIVEIPIENTQVDSLEPRKRRAKTSKRPPKKFHMPDGVDTGFRFLGVGRKGTHQNNKTTDKTLATLPELDKVLLSDRQHSELNDKYASVAGNEPQFVHVVHLESHPEKLHEQDKTELVEHSCVTKRLLKASKAMRRSDRDWNRPRISEIVSSFPSETIIGEDVEKRRTQKMRHLRRKSSPTIPLPRIDHGSSEDDYDVNDSFVDDESMETEIRGAKSSDDPDEVLSPARHIKSRKEAPSRQPFYTSQEESQQSDNDLDLPDMGDLFTHSKTISMARKGKMRKRGRHPIVSDDDDNE